MAKPPGCFVAGFIIFFLSFGLSSVIDARTTPFVRKCLDPGDVAFAGVCYRFVESVSPVTYDAAVDYCRHLGTNKTLATVGSKRHQLFLANYLETRGWPDALIGLRLVKTAWHWVLPLDVVTEDVTQAPVTMLDGQGCYGNSKIDISSSVYSAQLTQEGCVTFCRERQKPFAGVQSGTLCICSDHLPAGSELADNCTMKCSGDSSQLCGNHRSVYYYSAFFNLTSQFNNWVPSKPGKDGGCAASIMAGLSNSSAWIDVACSVPLPFVCQFNRSLTNSSSASFASWPTNSVVSSAKEKGFCSEWACYVFYPRVMLDFAAANKFCAKKGTGGRLVRIDSAADQVIVNRLITQPHHASLRQAAVTPPSAPFRFWIGATSREFVWADGVPLRPGYSAWAEETEPPLGSQHLCVRMSSFEGAYNWKTRTCEDLDGSKTFICSGPGLNAKEMPRQKHQILANENLSMWFESTTTTATTKTTTTTPRPEASFPATVTIPTRATSRYRWFQSTFWPTFSATETTEEATTMEDTTTVPITRRMAEITHAVRKAATISTSRTKPTTSTALASTTSEPLAEVIFRRKLDEFYFVVFNDASPSPTTEDDFANSFDATTTVVSTTTLRTSTIPSPTVPRPAVVKRQTQLATSVLPSTMLPASTVEQPSTSTSNVAKREDKKVEPVLISMSNAVLVSVPNATSTQGTSSTVKVAATTTLPWTTTVHVTTSTVSPSTTTMETTKLTTTTVPSTVTPSTSTSSSTSTTTSTSTSTSTSTTTTTTTATSTTTSTTTERSTTTRVRSMTTSTTIMSTSTAKATTTPLEATTPLVMTTLAPTTQQVVDDETEFWPTTAVPPLITRGPTRILNKNKTTEFLNNIRGQHVIHLLVHSAPKHPSILDNGEPDLGTAATTSETVNTTEVTTAEALVIVVNTTSAAGANNSDSEDFIISWWHIFCIVVIGVVAFSITFYICYCYGEAIKRCMTSRKRDRRVSPTASAGTSHHVTPALSSRDSIVDNKEAPIGCVSRLFKRHNGPVGASSTSSAACASEAAVLEHAINELDQQPVVDNGDKSSPLSETQRTSCGYRVWPAIRIAPVNSSCPSLDEPLITTAKTKPVETSDANSKLDVPSASKPQAPTPESTGSSPAELLPLPIIDRNKQQEKLLGLLAREVVEKTVVVQEEAPVNKVVTTKAEKLVSVSEVPTAPQHQLQPQSHQSLQQVQATVARVTVITDIQLTKAPQVDVTPANFAPLLAVAHQETYVPVPSVETSTNTRLLTLQPPPPTQTVIEAISEVAPPPAVIKAAPVAKLVPMEANQNETIEPPPPSKSVAPVKEMTPREVVTTQPCSVVNNSPQKEVSKPSQVEHRHRRRENHQLTIETSPQKEAPKPSHVEAKLATNENHHQLTVETTPQKAVQVEPELPQIKTSPVRMLPVERSPAKQATAKVKEKTPRDVTSAVQKDTPTAVEPIIAPENQNVEKLTISISKEAAPRNTAPTTTTTVPPRDIGGEVKPPPVRPETVTLAPTPRETSQTARVKVKEPTPREAAPVVVETEKIPEIVEQTLLRSPPPAAAAESKVIVTKEPTPRESKANNWHNAKLETATEEVKPATPLELVSSSRLNRPREAVSAKGVTIETMSKTPTIQETPIDLMTVTPVNQASTTPLVEIPSARLPHVCLATREPTPTAVISTTEPTPRDTAVTRVVPSLNLASRENTPSKLVPATPKEKEPSSNRMTTPKTSVTRETAAATSSKFTLMNTPLAEEPNNASRGVSPTKQAQLPVLTPKSSANNAAPRGSTSSRLSVYELPLSERVLALTEEVPIEVPEPAVVMSNNVCSTKSSKSPTVNASTPDFVRESLEAVREQPPAVDGYFMQVVDDVTQANERRTPAVAVVLATKTPSPLPGTTTTFTSVTEMTTNKPPTPLQDEATPADADASEPVNNACPVVIKAPTIVEGPSPPPQSPSVDYSNNDDFESTPTTNSPREEAKETASSATTGSTSPTSNQLPYSALSGTAPGDAAITAATTDRRPSSSSSSRSIGTPIPAPQQKEA